MLGFVIIAVAIIVFVAYNSIKKIQEKRFNDLKALAAAGDADAVREVQKIIEKQYGVEIKDTGVTITAIYGKLKDGNIPATIEGKPVTAIANKVFTNTDLSNIVIPEYVTSIGSETFDCESLVSIQVVDGNNAYRSINGILFSKNGETLIFCPRGIIVNNETIPKGVKHIGDRAFARIKLTEITIPDSVISIGQYAFLDCGLTSITIPDSTKKIKGGAFEGNDLTSVYVGADVDISSTPDAICKSFAFYYGINNKLSGLYRYPGARWVSEQERKRLEEKQKMPQYQILFLRPSSVVPAPYWVHANNESEAKEEFMQYNHDVLRILSIKRV